MPNPHAVERSIQFPEQTDPMKEPDAKVEIRLTRSNAEGLLALIHWIMGFEAASQASVPGAFELTMHYRTLRYGVSKRRREEKENESS